MKNKILSVLPWAILGALAFIVSTIVVHEATDGSIFAFAAWCAFCWNFDGAFWDLFDGITE